MVIKRFSRPIRQLQGKLTVSYTLTSVVTFLLVEVIFIGAALIYSSLNIPFFVENGLKQEAPQAAPYFVHGSPNRAELTSWLQLARANMSKLGPFHFPQPIFLAVINLQGQTIASIGTHPVPSGTSILAHLSPQESTQFHKVLDSVNGTATTTSQEADGTLVVITPIVGNAGNVEGAILIKTAQPDTLQTLTDFLALIILSSVIITVIATIGGLVSGYLTSRGLTSRFRKLSSASDKWSRGDFSALALDDSEDELGQLAHRLNQMAKQLQNLLQARQKLATSEERNRLARDLHDSVKQQVFAISMQIGATKVLLKRDIDAAEVRLNEADKLVRQAQQELTSLIRELRPVALEGKGLVTALRELTTQWAQQTEIVANVGAEEILSLSLAVEEALFRIAQEALANVARHSKATLVQMTLMTTDEIVTLSIVDNGQGFETTNQWRRGVGFYSMQERMKALGGDIKVESTPGKGTRVTAYCNRLGVQTNTIENNTLTASHESHDEKPSEMDTYKNVERI